MNCQSTIQPSHSNLGGWIILGLVVTIIVLDIFLYKTHRPTISQWIRFKTKGRKWWKILGMGIIGITLWHLFFGGPI